MESMPVAAEVNHDRQPPQSVAEHAAEQGRTHQRMVGVAVENVDQQRHGEPAAAEGGADHHIQHHPGADGKAVVHVGHIAHTEQKAPGDEIGRDQHEQTENQEGPGDDFAAERPVRGGAHDGRSCPSLSFSAGSSCLTLRRASMTRPPSRAIGAIKPL